LLPVATLAGASVDAVRTDEIIRRRIAVLIADRGIMKHRFAKAADRTPSWVPMFLRGERPFPIDRMDDVAKFFQYTPERLIAPLTDEELKRSTEALRQFRRRAPATRSAKRG